MIADLLCLLAGAPNRLRELKERWDRSFEHPVTRPNLSPEAIERCQIEMQLSPEQVERLRQRLPIRLGGEQLLQLERRMREAGRANQSQAVRPAPPSGPPQSAPPTPAEVERYYEQVRRNKWRGLPEEMRGGLRVDRWGVVFRKNPQGRGWRELGTDGEFEVSPNSSW